MRDRTYGLGIDVGDSTVVAAVCRHADGGVAAPEPLPLGRGTVAGPAAVALVGGRLSVLPPPGPGPAGGLVEHVLQRVGAPTPLVGAGRGVPAAAAVAAIAVRVHEVATRAEGSAAAWTVLTVPPSWGSHRRDLLAAALDRAGLSRCSVVSAATAVVRAHVGSGALTAGSTVAVYDLGASSLDTAVLRTSADGAVEQLAAPPTPLAWGGRDLDDAVVAHVVGSLPGGAAPTDPGERAALRRACVAAKEALSTETDVRVDLQVDGAACAVRVVREDVEDSVAEAVEDSVDVVRRAVAAAGRTVDDLDAVVLAGGSARVPLVAETLSAELGRPLVVDREPALTAACGAARLALDLRATAVPTATAPGAADEPADEPVDEALLPAAAAPRPVARRRRAGRPAAAPVGAHPARRHLQRAAVLTTAVLALWAGSASLVAVLDPAGSSDPLGTSSAGADEEPAPRGAAEPGPAAADPAGEVASGPIAPVALERDRTDAPSTGAPSGDQPAGTAAPAGKATRAASGTVPGTASPGRTAPAGTPAAAGGTSTGAVPETPPASEPGTTTGGPPVSRTPTTEPVPGTTTEPTPGSTTGQPRPRPTPGPEPTQVPVPTQVPDPTPTEGPTPSPVDPLAPPPAPTGETVPAGEAAASGAPA